MADECELLTQPLTSEPLLSNSLGLHGRGSDELRGWKYHWKPSCNDRRRSNLGARKRTGGVTALYSVSCPSAADCMVVGSLGQTFVILTTTDGGSTWTTHQVPSEDEFHAIACANDLDCTAVGGNEGAGGAGVVLVTTDGGAT